MKKISSLLIFGCLSLSIFAQPKNTNQHPQELYDEALTIVHCNPLRKELLEKAAALQETEPFEVFHLSVKAALAMELSCGEAEVDTTAVDAVIALAKKNLGSDNEILAKTLVKLTSETQLTTPQQAIRYAKVALEIWETPSKDYFNFLTGEFIALLYSLELQMQIINYTEQAKKKLDKIGGNEPYLWTLYYTLKVYTHSAFEEHEQTIIAAKKALTENEQHKVLTSLKVSTLYMLIASAYAHSQNEQESEKWSKRYAEYSSPDTLDYHLAHSYYHRLGILKAEVKKFDESVVFLEKALEQIEPHVATNQEDVKLLYINLVHLHIYLKNYNKAKKYIDKTFELGYDVKYSTAYNVVFRNLGDYLEGLNHTEQALRASIPDFNPTSIYENPSLELETSNEMRVAQLLGQKLMFLFEIGIANKDVELLKKSILTGEVALGFGQKANFGGLYESGEYYQNRALNQPIIEQLLLSAVGLYELNPSDDNLNQIFKYIERTQSKLLAQALAPRHLPEATTVQKNNLMKEVQLLQQKISFNQQSTIVKEYEQQLYETNNKLEALMKQIKQEYPTTFNITDDNFVTLPEVAKNIDAETVLIYIIRQGVHNFLLTMDNKNQQFVRKIGDKTVSDAIKDLPILLKSPFLAQEENTAKFIDASATLYGTFIQPIEEALVDKTKIIFILSEDLSHLPLEVLLPTNEKKSFHELDFLIKKFDISYQYSGTIYHRLKQKTPILDKSLLAFAPVFEDKKVQTNTLRSVAAITDTTKQETRNEDFIQLPQSETEVKKIVEIVQQNGGTAGVLLKSQANKAVLQDALQSKSYQFVHLATHGIVNFNDPRLSGLLCYETSEDVEKTILFGGEVQYSNIEANLVVLSSCESGIGRIAQGEGLLALNRSFIYSGARNVLFSLWKVNDAYTADLMIDFYDFYFKNNTHAAALRAAKLKMLQDPTTALPTYWAAFVLIGE